MKGLCGIVEVVRNFCNMMKKVRAYGECLGANRRRRTRQAAKSLGKLQASDDPGISEWGNLIEVILDRSYLNT